MGVPAASIIVPLFDKAGVVMATIGSVLAQSVADFELIVVDDGSTDGGGAAVAGLDDPRIRVLRQANSGPGAARNRGLAAARAPYVAFLDADDEWEPDLLRMALAGLEAQVESAAWVSGHVEGPARKSNAGWHRSLGLAPGTWRVSPGVSPRGLKSLVDFCHSSCIVARREIVRRYGGYYEADRCSYGEDSYLWLQVLLNHPVELDLAPRVWFHTEHSSLGAARYGRHPTRPALTAGGPLRERCDPAYRRALDDLLAYYRLLETEKLARQGKLSPAELAEWRRRFPWRTRPGGKLALLELLCSAGALAGDVRRSVLRLRGRTALR